MLLAVLSVSMLQPVELSRMVSRSPSSVTGLCSGAGIPPVWTNTRTYTHTHTRHDPVTTGTHLRKKNLVHTYPTVCMRVQTHSTHKYTLESTTPRYTQASDAEKWLSMVTHAATTASNTQTHTHTGHMARREKDCQCFTSVTVQINAIWPWDNTPVKWWSVYVIQSHKKIQHKQKEGQRIPVKPQNNGSSNPSNAKAALHRWMLYMLVYDAVERLKKMSRGRPLKENINKNTSQQPAGRDKAFLSPSLSLASCLGLKWESRTNSYGLIISVDRESVRGTLLKVDPYLLEGACWARQGS